MSFLKGLIGKYKWSFYLLMAYLVVDIFLHKGMVRVLLPSSFRHQVIDAALPKCSSRIPVRGGKWAKAVNSSNDIPVAVQDYHGLEMDVYYDTLQNDFLLFHDSSENQRTPVAWMLRQLQDKKYTGALWLDFKNLGEANEEAALRRLVELACTYHLYSRMMVEAGHPENLRSFCEEGFFTSYYVPLFNPYLLGEKELAAHADAIAEKCRQFPVSALSGYYFQYPFLKESFPGMPLLTWVDDPGWSVVNFFFQRKLRKDSSLAAVITN